MINSYYARNMKLWVAYYTDEYGQLGDSSNEPTLELAIYHLGYDMGAHPERYTRAMSHYFAEIELLRLKKQHKQSAYNGAKAPSNSRKGK